MRLLHLYLVLCCMMLCHVMRSQQLDMLGTSTADSVKTRKAVKKAIYGNARTAAMLSAALPGAGQAYNRQGWKIPIVYAALGGLGYWAYTNNKNYKYYSNNLRALYDGDPNTINESAYSGDQLIAQKREAKRFRDLALIFCGAVYALNIIDANVAAHLKTFDVSDDLSLQVKPYSTIGYHHKLQTGLTIKFTFK